MSSNLLMSASFQVLYKQRGLFVYLFILAVYKRFAKFVHFLPPTTVFPPFKVQKVLILSNPFNCSGHELRSKAAVGVLLVLILCMLAHSWLILLCEFFIETYSKMRAVI